MHKTEMEHFLVETRAFRRVIELLDEKGHVVIKGNPGSGKTTLAKYALSVMCERGKRPFQIYSMKDLCGQISPGENISIFIDNMFGEYSLKDDEVHDFNVREEFFKSITQRSKTGTSNILIMTIRSDIYNECTKLMENEKLASSMLDISSGEYELQIEEIQTLLQKYGLQNVTTLLGENFRFSGPLGFPQCCRLMRDTCDIDLEKELLDFCKRPLSFLREYLKRQLSTNPIAPKNAVLIYLLLNGGFVKSSVILSVSEDKEKKRISSEMIGITGINFIMKFQTSVNDYRGFLITIDSVDDVYMFSHSSVQESTFKVFCEFYPEKIIENCDPYLLENLTTNPRHNDTQVKVTENLFHVIFSRILKIIDDTEISGFESISLLDLWKDETFLEKFRSNKTWFLALSEKRDKDGMSLMVHFARAGNSKWIDYLLPDSDEQQKYFSLNAACARNQKPIVDRLLSVNTKCDLTTCFFAVQSGNLELLLRLCESMNLMEIAHSLHPMWISVKGSLLREICLMGKNDFIDPVLHRFPHLINVKDEQSSSTLQFVAYAGEIEIFQKLVRKGCDVFERTNHGSTVLHFACQGGKLEMVKFIIMNYPDLLQSEYNDFDGWSPLHWTAQSGRIDLLNFLLDKENYFRFDRETLNISDRTALGKTVFHIACMKGNLEMCRYLSEHYPTIVNMEDYDNENVLHDAAWGGNVKLFEFLVGAKFDANSTRNDGKTVLHQCCMSGKIDMCKDILVCHAELLNVKDRFGYSALHDAAWGGNIELFGFLLGKGLNINCRANNGKTVLHACCQNGKVDMCMYLVNEDANLLSVRDNNGYTVLHDAAKSQSKDLFEYLLTKGLQVNGLTQLGKTVLHVACIENNVFMVEYLASQYPLLLGVVDYNGNNVLHDAAWGGTKELLACLVCEGLDTNATRTDGKTILHMCCMNGKLNMATHIIDHYPCLLFVRDRDGYTALHDSVKGQSTELVSYLLSKGLLVTDRTFMDQTILHVACMRGQYHMCKYLVDNFLNLLNENDKYGNSILHATAWGGNVDLLMLLLVHGLEINCKRNDGKTVLHMSCMNGKISMCRYLLFYYPHLQHVRDDNGEEALQNAVLLGHSDLIDIQSAHVSDSVILYKRRTS